MEGEGLLPAFSPPAIPDNPTGSGPNRIPDEWKDVPYQPFSKSDRLGKVSDWTSFVYSDRRFSGGKNQPPYGRDAGPGYYHEDDEAEFKLVDWSKSRPGPRYGPQRRFQHQQRRREVNAQRDERRKAGAGLQKLGGRQRNQLRPKKRTNDVRRYTRRDLNRSVERTPSVDIRPEWDLLQVIDFGQLAKLYLEVEDAELLRECGKLRFYDKSYDRVNTKTGKALQNREYTFHNVTTSDDPVIRELAGSEEGNVFATDTILAALMACTRSVYSWDIVIQKTEKAIFLDKRDNSEFDLLTVSETAQDPPSDENADSINSPNNLAIEATYINQMFSQQVLLDKSKGVHSFASPNPFAEKEEEEVDLASVGYRYFRWKIGEGITLVARTQVDAAMPGATSNTLLTIKSLNEYDPRMAGIDWRQKLDTQPGSVLAMELKNNRFKLGRWTASALLSGADQLRLGYVSRLTVRENSKHVVLGCQLIKPKELAQQITFQMGNAWGIVCAIVNLVREKPDGKYLLMKDPNKTEMLLYRVTADAFEESEEEGDEEIGNPFALDDDERDL